MIGGAGLPAPRMAMWVSSLICASVSVGLSASANSTLSEPSLNESRTDDRRSIQMRP